MAHRLFPVAQPGGRHRNDDRKVWDDLVVVGRRTSDSIAARVARMLIQIPGHVRQKTSRSGRRTALGQVRRRRSQQASGQGHGLVVGLQDQVDLVPDRRLAVAIMSLGVTHGHQGPHRHAGSSRPGLTRPSASQMR